MIEVWEVWTKETGSVFMVKPNRFRFRAWDGKTMRRDFLIDAGGDHIQDHSERSIYGLILMQSTGLCDKSGKEIFEGDIFDGFIDDEPFKWKVAWENHGDFAGWSLNCRNAEQGEVIGNIYENPELLKGK